MAAVMRVCISDNNGSEGVYRIEKDGSLWTYASDKGKATNEIGLIAVEGLIGGYEIVLEDATANTEFSERENFMVNNCEIDYEG